MRSRRDIKPVLTVNVGSNGLDGREVALSTTCNVRCSVFSSTTSPLCAFSGLTDRRRRPYDWTVSKSSSERPTARKRGSTLSGHGTIGKRAINSLLNCRYLPEAILQLTGLHLSRHVSTSASSSRVGLPVKLNASKYDSKLLLRSMVRTSRIIFASAGHLTSSNAWSSSCSSPLRNQLTQFGRSASGCWRLARLSRPSCERRCRMCFRRTF